MNEIKRDGREKKKKIIFIESVSFLQKWKESLRNNLEPVNMPVFISVYTDTEIIMPVENDRNRTLDLLVKRQMWPKLEFWLDPSIFLNFNFTLFF